MLSIFSLKGVLSNTKDFRPVDIKIKGAIK